MELIIFILSLVIFTILFKFIGKKLNLKLSWLLPLVLGFTVAIILSVSAGIYFKNSDLVQSQHSNEVVINGKKIVENSDTKDMTEKDAYTFAQQLALKISDDSEYVEKAYKNNDIDKLNSYIKEWSDFANTPFSKVEMQNSNGLPYFPNTPLMSPYIKCDTAFIDLNLMTNAYYRYLKYKTEPLEKIKAKQQAQFQKSKLECEKIIAKGVQKSSK